MTLATDRTQNFSEVLARVKSGTGILALSTSTDDLRMCLHLSGERVQAVFVNGRPLRCTEEARRLLLGRCSEPATRVQFEQALPEDLRKGLSIPVDALLAQAPAPSAPDRGPVRALLQKIRQRFGHGLDPS